MRFLFHQPTVELHVQNQHKPFDEFICAIQAYSLPLKVFSILLFFTRLLFLGSALLLHFKNSLRTSFVCYWHKEKRIRQAPFWTPLFIISLTWCFPFSFFYYVIKQRALTHLRTQTHTHLPSFSHTMISNNSPNASTQTKTGYYRY